MVARASRREEVYAGPHVDRAPEIEILQMRHRREYCAGHQFRLVLSIEAIRRTETRQLHGEYRTRRGIVIKQRLDLGCRRRRIHAVYEYERSFNRGLGL